MKKPDIWVDGKLLEWENATVHVLCHSLQRGSTIFESIDCSTTPNGRAAIFRLTDHMARFLNSAAIIGMPIPYSLDELNEGVIETVRASGMTECTIRPLAFYPDPVMDGKIICQRQEDDQAVLEIKEVPKLKPEYEKEAE